jgi:hypothetical protein
MDSFSTAGAFVQKHKGGLRIIVWEVPLIKHFFREFPRRREESSLGKKPHWLAVIAADFHLAKPSFP